MGLGFFLMGLGFFLATLTGFELDPRVDPARFFVLLRSVVLASCFFALFALPRFFCSLDEREPFFVFETRPLRLDELFAGRRERSFLDARFPAERPALLLRALLARRLPSFALLRPRAARFSFRPPPARFALDCREPGLLWRRFATDLDVRRRLRRLFSRAVALGCFFVARACFFFLTRLWWERFLEVAVRRFALEESSLSAHSPGTQKLAPWAPEATWVSPPGTNKKSDPRSCWLWSGCDNKRTWRPAPSRFRRGLCLRCFLRSLRRSLMRRWRERWRDEGFFLASLLRALAFFALGRLRRFFFVPGLGPLGRHML